MKHLAAAVNKAFFTAYPSSVDIIGQGESLPQEEYERLLCKRVAMLLDDLLCTRTNFRVTNEEVVRLDCKIRSIRLHWWQFWRRPRG